MISGFYYGVLRCYASLTGSELQTFRDIPSIPSSETKRSKNLGRTTYWSHFNRKAVQEPGQLDSWRWGQWAFPTRR